MIDDDVRFTVYRPEALPPGAWKTLLVFAHKSQAAVAGDVHPPEEVERRAQRVLADVIDEYRSVGQDVPLGIPRESEITLVPHEASGSIQFNPREQRFVWLESVHQCEFRLRAAPNAANGVRHGSIRVFLGVLLIAEVPLHFMVNASPRGPARVAHAASTAPLRRVFASYSHADSHIVRLCERSAEALGLKYLRDVRELRAGEAWSEGLAELIRQSHVFQLFWSSTSMRSPYVRAEWEYALAIGKPLCPVYWEAPRPCDPAAGLPPAELSRLHFVDLSGRAELAGTGAWKFEPGDVRSSPPDAPIRGTLEQGDSSLEESNYRLSRTDSMLDLPRAATPDKPSPAMTAMKATAALLVLLLIGIGVTHLESVEQAIDALKAALRAIW